MIPELQNTLLGRKRRANEGEGIMNNTFTNRPVTMNENKNLLEIEEHMYILDDVKKPNVFRNMFPYSEIPKIPFNDRTVPHDMPKDIWITDTTFRDGQQSRAPYSTEQIGMQCTNVWKKDINFPKLPAGFARARRTSSW